MKLIVVAWLVFCLFLGGLFMVLLGRFSRCGAVVDRPNPDGSRKITWPTSVVWVDREGMPDFV
jgi:hypothetical protein